jgi:hypothetical protein
MRYQEFLTEAVQKNQVITALKNAGYEDIKVDGNVILALVQIPAKQKKDAFRAAILNDILNKMQSVFPESNPRHFQARKFGSLGGIVFDDSAVGIAVKDLGQQGEKSAGIANEVELASLIKSVIEKYGSANVTFVDPRGNELTINDATQVDLVGRDVKGRKKSDVTLVSKTQRLPISIKKLNADAWESADSLFGPKAKEILLNLQDQGVIELKKFKDDSGRVFYQLSKEIVVEPTEEESMKAIFGSDINPEGGVVIQTFKPEHFRQDGNNVFVECHAIIREKADIPESHMMVWLIRNAKERNNPLPGLRTLGVTLKRGIGAKGDKPVILVDRSGRVIRK